MQQESIYNILPKKRITQDKELTYKSRYPYWIAPTGSTFNLQNSSYPNVSNLSGTYELPRGAHPILRQSATFGISDIGKNISPERYHKKGDLAKKLPPLERLHTLTEVRKPPVPSLKEKPIMGLKTEKNYIISNVLDNILMVPKKIKEEETDIYRHKSYGKVPKYLCDLKLKIKDEYDSIKELQRKRKEEDEKKQRLLTEEEVNSLREGLRKKWEMYSNRYERLSHKKEFDNLVLLRK